MAPPPPAAPAPQPLPIPIPASLTPKQRLAWRIALGVLVAYTLSLFVPFAPAMPSVELDASWYMILHWAFLKGLDFGTEIVFTYGPWGFVFQGYHPSTFIYSLITWVLMATTCLLVMLQAVKRLTGNPWLQGLMIFGFMAMIGSSIRGMHDVRLMVTCWSLLLLHFYLDPRPLTKLKAALVLALAIISLGKFSLAIVAFGVILLISIEILSRKVIPWVLYIYLGALVVLWLAAGQSPLGVIPYLRNSLLITSGFSQGVGKDSLHEVRDVVIFILCALSLLGVIVAVQGVMFRRALAAAASWKEAPVIAAGLRLLLVAGWLAAMLLMLFKMGYVRHDEHELLATTGLAALAVMFLVFLWPTALTRRLRQALVGCTSLCLLLMVISFQVWVPWGLAGQLVRTLGYFPSRTWDAAVALTGGNRAIYEEMLEGYRAFRPLPPVEGTVDAISWFQYSVLAHNMDYLPRPVIQGYLAYTPELGRMNADFLRTRAPQSILFDVQAIDGYPMLGEAASIPVLLDRYELVSTQKGALHLKLPERPRTHSRGLLQQTRAKMGEWIPVPASGHPVWATLKFTPTARGKLATALYKPPSIYLNLKSQAGPVIHSRLVPGIASEGFLLSPIILDNRMHFAMLWSSEWRELLQRLMVTEIQVVVGEGEGEETHSSYAYSPEFELTFEELRYEHGDINSVPGVTDYFGFERFMQVVEPYNAVEKTDTKNEDWTPVLYSPEAQWLLNVPSGAAGVRVSYGMLKDSWSHPIKTEGVTFRVYAAGKLADGTMQAQLLWSRQLTPATVEAHQGMQLEDIALPTPTPPQILLETEPAGSKILPLSYWGGAVFLARE